MADEKKKDTKEDTRKGQLKYSGGSVVNIKRTAGINYAKLYTFAPGKEIAIHMVLKELPSFGLSTNWENAPIGDLGSKIQEFFCSDLMKATAYAFGSNWQNQINIDEWTSRMFVGTTNNEINLKWRVYSNNTLGQTPAKTALSYLRDYATISTSAKTDMGTLINNVKNVLAGAQSEGGAAAAEMVSLLFGANADKDEEAKVDWLVKANTWYNANFESVWTKVKNKYMESIEKNLPFGNSQTNYKSQYDNGTDAATQAKINHERDIKAVKNLDITKQIDLPTERNKALVEKEYEDSLKIEFYWYDPDGTFVKNNTNGENIDKVVMDLNKLEFSADNLLHGFSEDNDWTKAWNKSLQEKIIREFAAEINKGMREVAGDTDALRDALGQGGNSVFTRMGDKLTNMGGSNFKDDNERVKIKNLGSSLWKLELYPFIFKKPLVVTVNNWTVTPSKEMYGTSHVYYDFEVSVKMDQIASAEKWSKIFNGK